MITTDDHSDHILFTPLIFPLVNNESCIKHDKYYSLFHLKECIYLLLAHTQLSTSECSDNLGASTCPRFWDLVKIRSFLNKRKLYALREREMKELFGSPGTKSGLVLRIGQSFFAASSIGIMASASGFSTATAFCYLIASMGLQFLWSFGLACIDVHALKFNKDLHNQIIVSLFVVGDWVTATLSLAAACSSAGVAVLYNKDSNICKEETNFSCNMFQISIAFAFASWFLLALSSHVMFWLVASI